MRRKDIDADQFDAAPMAGESSAMLAMVYYTLAGIALYLIADWILNRIEIRRGARLEHRTLIFFGILLVLALITFQLIQHFLVPPPAAPPATPPPQ